MPDLLEREGGEERRREKERERKEREERKPDSSMQHEGQGK